MKSVETKVTVEFAGREFSISTGEVAKQASGSVVVQYGDTIVLVTACAEKKSRENVDFVPLTIEYAEKSYAAGKIPGGFFKREMGRPSEIATLTARLIDRPIRPLFPDGYSFETQVIATVLSYDKKNEPGVAALIGASAALSISDIPFDGPIAGVRVARIDGKFICNPGELERENSNLDLFVAASQKGILMVEAGAEQVTEKDMIDALLFAEESCQPIIKVQRELIAKCSKDKFSVKPPEFDQSVREVFDKEIQGKISHALKIKPKLERRDALAGIKESLVERFTADIESEGKKNKIARQISCLMEEFTNKIAREITLKEGRRIDGRAYDEVRDIWGRVAVLPRTHGSAIFTRGETQSLVTCTLGTGDDEQLIDTMEYYKKDNFLLHYNFPPYSVGEVKRLMSPGRRELGHGNLAKRAISYMLPSSDEFEYTVRLVSEVLESNGSSSMATVCGASMALLDAGVPCKSMIAGIAMGLVKDGDKVAILTDIIGDEDHFGDMDFKVCGTRQGITALQMDIKIRGVKRELLTEALEQARVARLFILDKMEEVIREPRSELSEYAPVITSIDIRPDKVKLLIGPGGRNIKAIIAATGTRIEVDENGKANVASTDPEKAHEAIRMIKELIADPEVGKTYEGLVKKIMPFGAFVEIMPRVEGLLHISEIEHRRIDNVEEVLKEGDRVNVQLLAIERDGKLRLSRKALIPRDKHR